MRRIAQHAQLTTRGLFATVKFTRCLMPMLWKLVFGRPLDLL